MPQFKRFVAYLYYYENDTKEYLAGFARVEMRGGICRLEIHLKGTEYAGQEGKVSLFIRREGKILAFPVGNMRLMSQSSDYSGRISDGELGDETCHIQDVCGILIQPADGNFYGSQWDNGEIHKEEIEMQAAEEPSLQTEEVPMHHISGTDEHGKGNPGKKHAGKRHWGKRGLHLGALGESETENDASASF